MRVAFYTLGCKVNQYETQILRQLFLGDGHTIVPSSERADVYVINSCTVTAASDSKVCRAVRRFKRTYPGSIVVLCGCLPQTRPDIFLPEADIITGVSDRRHLLSYIDEFFRTGKQVISVSQHTSGEDFEPMCAEDFSERTRAFVKIEDGCDHFCSYCIIPYARGTVRSKDLDDIKGELDMLASKGYHEVVLCGINLLSYGRGTPFSYIDAVYAACERFGRVRLGSLEPDLVSVPDIEALKKAKNLCPHFHMSLQSGCDATLKRMNRRYDSSGYLKLCEDLRSAFGNAAITTDIMVGFPGEDEAEFEQSMRFLEAVGFAKAHVFAFSPRPGTQAAVMPCQVTAGDKKRRARLMADTAERSRQAFMLSQKGLCCNVLFEHKKGGANRGYTENYTPVTVICEDDLRGRTVAVKITGTDPDGCTAVLTDI